MPSRMTFLAAVLVVAVAGAGCTGGGGSVAAPTTPAAGGPGSPVEVARGLAVPWGLAFATPNSGLAAGTALLGHRDSYEVSLVRPDGSTVRVGSLGNAADHRGESGLLGIALLPVPGKTTMHLFAYLTTGADNRLVRAVVTPDAAGGAAIGSPEVLLDGIPRNTIHDGGAVVVGPDGMLYVSTGDTGDGQLAQQRESFAGKILRMTPGGAVPPDNPFPGSYVYSYGHRNVQGLAFDADKRLWASEFGQNTTDEVNLITAGGNYGWPVFEGNARTGNGSLAEGASPILPAATFATSEASPSGLSYWRGALYLAALRGQRLWRLPIEGAGLGKATVAFDGYGRIRGTAVAPDGPLWFWTGNTDGRGRVRDGDDRILRVTLP